MRTGTWGMALWTIPIFSKNALSSITHQILCPLSRIINIATGANHTLVLLEIYEERRELWGCGDGCKGQHGRAYQQSSTTTLFRKLDLALEDAGLQNYRIKFISASWETSYVVLSCDGQTDVVLSMGSDDFGDLGIGGLKKGQPAKDVHIIRFDHIPGLSESLDVLGIYCGQRHVILYANATPPILVVWGSCRSHKQLGWNAEGAHTVGQIHFPNDLDRYGPFPKIACGSEHVLLLVAPTSTGPSQLWGWGWNEHGNLGVGHTDDVPAPIKLWTPPEEDLR